MTPQSSKTAVANTASALSDIPYLSQIFANFGNFLRICLSLVAVSLEVVGVPDISIFSSSSEFDFKKKYN